MSERLNLQEWRDRLAPGSWSSAVEGDLYIGAWSDVDYAEKFKTKRPAAWILGQAGYVEGDETEQGYSQIMRARTIMQVPLRLVTQRVITGRHNNQAQLDALYEAVLTRLYSWLPSGSETQVFYVAHEDGPANESMLSVDVVVGYVAVREA